MWRDAWNHADCTVLSPGMRPFLVRWFFTTIAVAVAAHLTGMRYDSLGSLIGAALLLGIVNALVRPILLLLSLPFILVTLGFFILVINALLLWMVGSVVPGFYVETFRTAFFGALIISIVSWALSSVFKASDGHYRVITHHAQLRSGEEKSIHGTVIE
jgi:putative membrane protein